MAQNTPPQIETGLIVAVVTPIAALLGALASKFLDYLSNRGKTLTEAELKREEIVGESNLEIRKLEVENEQFLLQQIHEEQKQIREHLHTEVNRLNGELAACRQGEERCRNDLNALRERVHQLENLRKHLEWDGKVERRKRQQPPE